MGVPVRPGGRDFGIRAGQCALVVGLDRVRACVKLLEFGEFGELRTSRPIRIAVRE
jgi:hypothetical protein